MRCYKLAKMGAEKRHEAMQVAGYRTYAMRRQEMILAGRMDVDSSQAASRILRIRQARYYIHPQTGISSYLGERIDVSPPTRNHGTFAPVSLATMPRL